MTEPTLAGALRRALPCNTLDCPNLGVFCQSLYEPDSFYCEVHADANGVYDVEMEDPDRALIARALALPELSNPRFLDQLTTEDLDPNAPWNAQGYS